MMFQGLPWPLVLPIAFLFLLFGSMQAKREIEAQKTKRKKKKK